MDKCKYLMALYAVARHIFSFCLPTLTEPQGALHGERYPTANPHRHFKRTGPEVCKGLGLPRMPKNPKIEGPMHVTELLSQTRAANYFRMRWMTRRGIPACGPTPNP